MKFIESRKFIIGFAAVALVFAVSAHDTQAQNAATDKLEAAVELFYKASELSGEEAIAIHDEIDRRFGRDDNPVIQEVVARSLYAKGWELNAQGKQEKAIAAYDEVARRFGRHDAPAILEQVINAQSDAAEAALILGRNQNAIQRAKAVQARVGSSPVGAIMSFIIWLAEPNAPLQSVQKAIQDVESDEAFNWSFKEVSPVIAKLPDVYRKQAECFVGYFEEPDTDELNACLEE
ncbi:MAG: hypothetical protein LBJ59_10605 [Zoogloeaceae bacterium]|jgi:tetratricopeptide (TPR) repeat protein|nr:hypothetical protein [Zoogloeaceae bacterium]